jgi:hypothetical protein
MDPVLAALCDQLTTIQTGYGGTNLVLSYEVKSHLDAA